MEKNGQIDRLLLEQMQKEYEKCKKNTVVRRALYNGPVTYLAKNGENKLATDFLFNVDIKTMSATNQRSSGRCWIFAACNVLREILGKRLGIKDFELSQNYVAFFDRLEKVNYELEAIIDLIDADHDDRTLCHVLDYALGDGGQWDMFVNIIKKYGIVPKKAMPETFQSNNTALTNRLLHAELRKFAYLSKKVYKEEGMAKVRELKNELLQNVYNLLTSAHGLVPTKFDFEYLNDKNEVCVEKDLTPKSFFDKYFKDIIDDYVSLTNAPTKDKPFNQTFTVKYLGNVLEGKKVVHLNVATDRLVELAKTQLKNGEVIWFGSDCSLFSDRDEGIWDDLSWDYKTPFGLDYDFTKEAGLDYFASVMNHAMVLTGVHLDENDNPVRWKVENSWGTEKAFSGYHVMSQSWFNRFVFQIVINKKYLNSLELDALKKEPIELKPWDPMGSLAD